MSAPVATVRAYRRKGGAVVTIQREGRPAHRYYVTLKRYRSLRQWFLFGQHPWRTSGSWLKSSLTACLWLKEARPDPPPKNPVPTKPLREMSRAELAALSMQELTAAMNAAAESVLRRPSKEVTDHT